MLDVTKLVYLYPSTSTISQLFPLSSFTSNKDNLLTPYSLYLDSSLYYLPTYRGDEQRSQLEHELEEIGIRLNRMKPDVVFKPKTAGGITINNTVPLTRIDERTIRGILQSYKACRVSS